MRELLVEDRKSEWEKYANPAIYNEYDNLRKIVVSMRK